ncbi:hypothetical protein ILUMI_21127 [Ignelater luminosus]|uniref:Uncharacterized protein n=1 Tax=Ignelater luminosus TaxID=2038154 RepID=A0A8K0CH02_IGNLU|nr:hypothetical protein ILUMI_21127 [Ignelater luminosus]
MNPSYLNDCSLWRHGPSFLLESPDKWPNKSIKATELPEEKKIVLVTQNARPDLPIKWLLNAEEIHVGNKAIIKIIQEREFSKEISELKTDKQVSSNSSVKGSNLFLETDGVIRVEGRLQNLKLQFDTRHQIHLPKSPKRFGVTTAECSKRNFTGQREDVDMSLKKRFGEEWIKEEQLNFYSEILKEQISFEEQTDKAEQLCSCLEEESGPIH